MRSAATRRKRLARMGIARRTPWSSSYERLREELEHAYMVWQGRLVLLEIHALRERLSLARALFGDLYYGDYRNRPATTSLCRTTATGEGNWTKITAEHWSTRVVSVPARIQTATKSLLQRARRSTWAHLVHFLESIRYHRPPHVLRRPWRGGALQRYVRILT